MTTEVNADFEHIRRQSFEWIRAAARLAIERFGAVEVSNKVDRSPVTEADFAVQEALLAAIARDYPGDAVITEEVRADPDAHPPVARSQRCWVVDPIDGTRNYARSIPVFTVSVALMAHGQPAVGVVYDPMRDRMYSASAGGGAWLDDQPIAARPIPEREEWFIGIPTSRYERLPRIVHDWIDRMMVRNFGSTALHLALVATGALDAAYCRRAKLWDLAAGSLIATEAGAELRSHTGQSYFPMDLEHYADEEMPFIAARPGVIEPLLADCRKPETD